MTLTTEDTSKTMGTTARTSPGSDEFSDEDSHLFELEDKQSKEDMDLNSSHSSRHTIRSSYTRRDSTTERDEIAEVHKSTIKETRRIHCWRFVMAMVLLATAAAVTATTYHFLKREQTKSFNLAFDKFSLAVGDAALVSQKTLYHTQRDVCDTLSIDAIRTQQTWPYYTNPWYEVHFGSALEQARAELSAFFPVVEADSRDEWINYAGKHLTEWTHAGHMTKYGNLDRLNEINYVPNMTKKGPDGFIPDDEWNEYWPMWLYSPPPAQYGAVNWNLINVPDYEAIVEAGKVLRGDSVITLVRKSVSTGTAFTEEEHKAMHSKLKTGSSPDHPHSFIWTPVYEDPEDVNSKFVAVLATNFAWDFSLRNLLPDNVEGIVVIIKNNCNQTYTYEISGKDAYFMGEGDLHDAKYDGYKKEVDLSLLKHPLKDVTPGHCQYSMEIYPSETFEAAYDRNTPEIFALIVLVTFSCIAVVVVVYDWLVRQRNDNLVEKAARSQAVVTSLFPGSMRDRILEQQLGTKGKMKKMLSDGVGFDNMGEDKPLADLFLETTVLFADITGFTAWSSVREPSQVFTLLENVYAAFDDVARQRRIFKVETVGDCYVAATGIPEPRKDHVVAMVRFGNDCIKKMKILTRKLERTLGPGTAELSLRVGCHSGPVTAGVLRGEKARFQLFGDTMNTAARIENTGEKDRIHVSKDTAEILRSSGKDRWVVPRRDKVHLKGLGYLDTFWVNVEDRARSNASTSQMSEDEMSPSARDDLWGEHQRLIDWNTEMLATFLKQIIARRGANAGSPNLYESKATTENQSGLPLKEVKEIISLPEFDHVAADKQVPVGQVTLDAKVALQLREYVSAIAELYYDNPFHSFQHASHVVMSVTKLMSRIVAPEAFHDNHDGPSSSEKSSNLALSMHDHTYGITSDPLTQFACAFSALIHDVDHRGVPNTQLIKENQKLAEYYEHRSVAEQNSLDLSWQMLMDKKYKDLLAALCHHEEELTRFRSLVVNGVMATDIADKQLKELRNNRWDKAFSEEAESSKVLKLDSRGAVNRKATIVIEHLIQASDISHTMQHWHIYRKWNEALFEEMYLAFKQGRAEKHPAEFWYKGEIGFFQFYIIPLTKKLQECGVFGVSSGEYLNYAENNLNEWERRGQEVVSEMVIKMKTKYEKTEAA